MAYKTQAKSVMNGSEELERANAYKRHLNDKTMADRDIQDALMTLMSISWIKDESLHVIDDD